MCYLPQPSLSVRVWNGSPHEFLIKAAELTRTGIGLPAYYNDEVIIPVPGEQRTDAGGCKGLQYHRLCGTSEGR